MARPTTRLPPIAEQQASEEPPTRFDVAVPDGWSVEGPSGPQHTVRLEVAIPCELPPPLPIRPEPAEMSPTTRVAIISACVGFVAGTAVTATMAMLIW